MSNWDKNRQRYDGFSTRVRRQAERELPQQCAQCGAVGVRLWLDHIVNHAAGGADDITNAQWLCTPCHDYKTATERRRGAAARAARGRHPVESHPGLRKPAQ